MSVSYFEYLSKIGFSANWGNSPIRNNTKHVTADIYNELHVLVLFHKQ